MRSLDDFQAERQELSPSMSRSAEDGSFNTEAPLLTLKKSNKLYQENNWYKNGRANDNKCSNNEKKSHHCIWMLTLLLACIGFCNLLLNLTILIVLRVSQGMEALEVIPEQDLLKFYGNTDLDRVCLYRGVCEGFGDEPIELVGDDAGVHIQIVSQHHNIASSNIQILKNETSISQIQSFQIKNLHNGSSIFSTDFPNFALPQGVRKIEVDIIQTHRITAPKQTDLFIKSDNSISMHGAEGTNLDSKNIVWIAKDDIFLRSRNGDFIIDAKDSIDLPNIPIAPGYLPNQLSEVQKQYKVCVCMPEGKLFLVPIHKGITKVNCATFSQSMESDPCALK